MSEVIVETIKQLAETKEMTKQSGCVQLIDVQRTVNNLYMIMEFYEKGDLELLMKEKEIFTEEEALKIIK